VGSNAIHTRDVMKSMLPIRQIERTMFNKADVDSLALEVERVAHQPQVADTLRDYVKSIEALSDDVRHLNLQADFTFRGIIKDLTKAEKLMKGQYPYRLDQKVFPTPETQTQLFDILTKLYVQRLPKDINTLYLSFVHSERRMLQLTELVLMLSRVFEEDQHGLVNALQLKPPMWRRAAWEKDDIVQRRVRQANATVGSFQRTMELGRAFQLTRESLWTYRQSLSLFESPRHLQPNHRRSNGTFDDFVHLIDEVMPQLTSLLKVYEI